MVVKYDPAVAFWRTLFRCRGSVIPDVVASPFFILQLLIHIVLLALDRLVEPIGAGAAEGADGGDEDLVEEDQVAISHALARRGSARPPPPARPSPPPSRPR